MCIANHNICILHSRGGMEAFWRSANWNVLRFGEGWRRIWRRITRSIWFWSLSCAFQTTTYAPCIVEDEPYSNLCQCGDSTCSHLNNYRQNQIVSLTFKGPREGPREGPSGFLRRKFRVPQREYQGSQALSIQFASHPCKLAP